METIYTIPRTEKHDVRERRRKKESAA